MKIGSAVLGIVMAAAAFACGSSSSGGGSNGGGGQCETVMEPCGNGNQAIQLCSSGTGNDCKQYWTVGSQTIDCTACPCSTSDIEKVVSAACMLPSSSSSSGGGSGSGSGSSSGGGGGTVTCYLMEAGDCQIGSLTASDCSSNMGMVVSSCPTTNLDGCCKTGPTEECYYGAFGGQTVQQLQANCTGTWSTTP